MKQFKNYEFTYLFDSNLLYIDRDIVFSLVFAQSDQKIMWFAFFAILLQTAVSVLNKVVLLTHYIFQNSFSNLLLVLVVTKKNKCNFCILLQVYFYQMLDSRE